MFRSRIICHHVSYNWIFGLKWQRFFYSIQNTLSLGVLLTPLKLAHDAITKCLWLSFVHLCAGEVNTLRPRQNGRHFPDNIFKSIFLNENIWISINISIKFAPRGPINNIPTLVQVTAWHRPGNKPLSEPMMVRLPTHICVTRPQWVKPGCCDNVLSPAWCKKMSVEVTLVQFWPIMTFLPGYFNWTLGS